ncbi:MAG: hypothetical protein UHB38_01100, partial [Anaerovibrio sp.]|uniref:O-linked N-acetylglucosamine transferase family protein n=1 Tax=Anaerovibrio sp. TaxID=1872532 RepID=UPI002EA7F0AD|nr:hypothetical protein [Anaerovibrio sp.]
MAEAQSAICTAEHGNEAGSQLSLLRQGFVCFGQKQYAAAIAFYKRALKEKGSLDLEVLLYLAEAYSARHDFRLAAITINKACILLDELQDKGTQEFQRSIRLRQGMYNRVAGNLHQAAEGYRLAAELYAAEDYRERAGVYGSYLMVLAGLDMPLAEFQMALAGYNEIFPVIGRPFPKGGHSAEKIRIGYISPDFRQHVMYGFYYYMLFGYNRELFHVTCYSLSEVQDAYTRSIQDVVDGWRLAASLSLDELADVIRQDKIDILVDLAGHSTG